MSGKKKVAPKLSVDIAGVNFKNPVVTASGTFGSGQEYSEFFELSKLGGIVTKGVSMEPWEGNATPRLAETPSGMLNAIGLQNPGVETFIESDLPFLKKYDTRIIVNICGHSVEDYALVAERLSGEDIDMLEVNISCPNVKEGGIAFGTDPKKAAEVTRAVKKASKKPVIMKLSPNVTDITEMAKACEDAGADAFSLINTITGMKIDVNTRRFALANKTGGLSGPAIHPVAVRMVYEVHQAVKLPIIGMGGIMDSNDAIEMMLAGASLVAVGTASFRRPDAAVLVIDGIEDYLFFHGFDDVGKLTGAVRK